MTKIPENELNPLAVAKANDRLWKNHPELHGRQLTMQPEDAAYRKEWMSEYKKAEADTVPPPPAEIPEPIPPPPPVIADSPQQNCPNVTNMTREQKMEEAINRAKLTPAVKEALGDIKTLVASMVIVGGVLAAIAATGYGAVAEAIAAALLLVGAAMSGVQIGQGITHIADFVEQTRCDKAKTPEDLDKAGKSFADGVANMGVGGLNLLLSLLGARGKAPTGKPIGEKPPVPPVEEKPPTPPVEEKPPAPAAQPGKGSVTQSTKDHVFQGGTVNDPQSPYNGKWDGSGLHEWDSMQSRAAKDGFTVKDVKEDPVTGVRQVTIERSGTDPKTGKPVNGKVIKTVYPKEMSKDQINAAAEQALSDALNNKAGSTLETPGTKTKADGSPADGYFKSEVTTEDGKPLTVEGWYKTKPDGTPEITSHAPKKPGKTTPWPSKPEEDW
jgi:hypothetical protein